MIGKDQVFGELCMYYVTQHVGHVRLAVTPSRVNSLPSSSTLLGLVLVNGVSKSPLLEIQRVRPSYQLLFRYASLDWSFEMEFPQDATFFRRLDLDLHSHSSQVLAHESGLRLNGEGA